LSRIFLWFSEKKPPANLSEAEARFSAKGALSFHRLGNIGSLVLLGSLVL
jgi:hypothetical protein